MHHLAAFCLALALLLAAPFGAAAREAILDYVVRVEVQLSGALLVSEEIEVEAEGRDIRRGIFRDLRLGGAGLAALGRAGFTLVEARRDGAAETARVQTTARGVRIYLGDPDSLLRPGRYRYRLVYEIGDQTDRFETFDELYWNATGHDWAFPIERAEVTVVPPPGASATRLAVYTGPEGASGAEARTGEDAAGNPVFRTTRALGPGEGMTVAVGWPTGFLDAPSAGTRLSRWLEANGALFFASVTLALVLAYYLVAWWRVGRDPPAGIVIPVYRPEMPPAAMRYVERMGFDDAAFAAAILSLAVKGHLVVGEEGGKQVLTRVEVGPGAREPSPGEAKLLAALFAAGGRVEIAEASRDRLSGAVRALQSHFGRTFNRHYFNTNRRWFILGAALTIAGFLLAAAFGSEDPFNIFAGLFVAAATISSGQAIIGLFRALRRVVARPSGRHLVDVLRYGLASLPTLGVLVFAAFFLGFDLGTGPILFLVAAALVNLVFFHLLRAPTTLGREALDEIEGTRLYLTVAEADRLRFAHPPDRTPEHFHELLPYATALGVETEWTDQFRDAIEAARAEGREGAYLAPSWNGGRPLGTRGLRRIGHDLARAYTAATAPRASAGSGGRGGSGGGGFSGGGRGGGGGGGW